MKAYRSCKKYFLFILFMLGAVSPFSAQAGRFLDFLSALDANGTSEMKSVIQKIYEDREKLFAQGNLKPGEYSKFKLAVLKDLLDRFLRKKDLSPQLEILKLRLFGEMRRAGAESKVETELSGKTSLRPSILPSLDLSPEAKRLRENIKKGKKGFFQVERDLSDYARIFPPEFIKILSSLGEAGRWLDAGCGDFIALEQHLTERTKRSLPLPSGVGVTYQSERIPPSFHGKLTIIKDRYFEDIENTELVSTPSEKFDLITDLYGPYTYTHELDRVILKYLELLKEEGVIMIAYGPADTWFKRIGSREQHTLEVWLSQRENLAHIEVVKSSSLGIHILLIRHPREERTLKFPALELETVSKGGLPPARRVFQEISGDEA